MRTSATETENFGGAPAAANTSLLAINKKPKEFCCERHRGLSQRNSFYGSANPGMRGEIILEAL